MIQKRSCSSNRPSDNLHKKSGNTRCAKKTNSTAKKTYLITEPPIQNITAANVSQKVVRITHFIGPALERLNSTLIDYQRYLAAVTDYIEQHFKPLMEPRRFTELQQAIAHFHQEKKQLTPNPSLATLLHHYQPLNQNVKKLNQSFRKTIPFIKMYETYSEKQELLTADIAFAYTRAKQYQTFYRVFAETLLKIQKQPLMKLFPWPKVIDET